jgi:hypothetical protein
LNGPKIYSVLSAHSSFTADVGMYLRRIHRKSSEQFGDVAFSGNYRTTPRKLPTLNRTLYIVQGSKQLFPPATETHA